MITNDLFHSAGLLASILSPKNMRLFYKAWNMIEANSSVETDELTCGQLSSDDGQGKGDDNEAIVIRKLQLTIWCIILWARLQ